MVPHPTVERCRDVLSYDPETGIVLWAKKTANKVVVGREAGTLRPAGRKMYKHFSLDKKFLLCHRVAWAIWHGYWPDQIDHVNGDGTDNRLSNLRETNHRGNCRNIKRPSNNTSGHVGVVWLKNEGRWRAVIKIDGKNVNLGSYVDIKDAVAAREAGNRRYGFHENHGSNRPHFGPGDLFNVQGMLHEHLKGES